MLSVDSGYAEANLLYMLSLLSVICMLLFTQYTALQLSARFSKGGKLIWCICRVGL